MMSMASQVSLIATSNSGGQTTPWTVPNPPGHQVGDAVLIVMSDDQLANSSNMSTNFLYGPNGFVQLPIQQTSNVDGQQLGCFIRVLDGTEGNTFVGRCAVNCSWIAQSLLFRGVDSSIPVDNFACYIDDVAFTVTSNSTTPAMPISDAGSALVWINCPDAHSGIANTTLPANFVSIGMLSEPTKTSLEVGVRTGVAPQIIPSMTGAVTPNGSTAAMATVLSIRPQKRLSSFLSNWYEQLRGNAVNGPAVVMFVGDDALEGAGASSRDNRAIDVLMQQMTAQYPIQGCSQYVPAVYACSSTGQTVATPWGGIQGTVTGSVTAQLSGIANGAGTPSTTFGFGMRSVQIANGASVVYDVYGSQVDAWFAQGGTFTYAIDAGTPSANIATNAWDVNLTRYANQIVFASDGPHTVTITSTNGTINFCGFTQYDSHSYQGLVFYDCSHTGSVVSDHYDVNTPSAPQNAKFARAVSQISPGLVVINLGMNDFKVISPSQLQTNLAGMVSAIRSVSNASIVLASPYQLKGWDDWTINFANGTSQQVDVLMNALAISNNIGRFHLTPPMPVAFSDSSHTYAADQVHLTDAGHQLLAETLSHNLFPVPTSGQTFGTFAQWDSTRANASIYLTNAKQSFYTSSSNVSMAATDSIEVSTATVYWEVSLVKVYQQVQLGLMSSSSNNFGVSLANGGLAYDSTGVFTSNGTVISSGHLGFKSGDVVTFALIHGSLWAGTVAGGWIGSPSANTGALITGLTGSYTAGFGLSGTSAIAAGTSNFGQTFWRGSIPVGCTGWQSTRGSIVYASYDPVSTSATALLSNTDMTLTSTGTVNNWDSAASTQSLVGKAYFEAILNNTETDSHVGVGVMQYAGGALGQSFVGSSSEGIDVGMYVTPQANSYYVFWNAGNISPTPNPSVGSATNPYRVGVAVDTLTRQVWMRYVWAGGSTAWAGGGDPASNTTPTATLTGTAPLFLVGSVQNNLDSSTILTNSISYLGTIPTGFVAGASNVPPPLSLTGTPPSGQVGTFYTYTFAASGGKLPVTYALTSGTFPAGLTMTSTGVLSGTPTTIATSSFSVTATDSASATSTLNTSVAIAAAPPMTLTGTLANGTVGVAYSNTLTLGGTFAAPVTIDTSVGSLPAWMSSSVSGSVVTFSGTPSTTATTSFTVRATDSTTPTAQVATSPQSVTVSAASASYVTLSATRKASTITLNGTSLQASTTDSGAAGTIDAAKCIDASSASLYWEVTATTITAASLSAIGLMSSTSTSYGSAIGTTGDSNSMALESGGTFNRTWGGTATGYTFAQGDTVTLWLHNGSLYMGKVVGGWFGGSAGGVPTTAIATGITGLVGPAYSADGSYGSSRIWTFNFGASAWLGTPPAGATGWPG